MLKLIPAAFAAAILSFAPAYAADSMPLSLSPFASVSAPSRAVNWNGFYIGINSGYGVSDGYRTENSFGGVTTTTTTPARNGWLFGGQAGANYMLGTHWLIGIETKLDATGLTGSRTDVWCTPATCMGFSGRTKTTIDLDWLGMTQLKLGYLVTPRLAVYALAGVGYGQLTTYEKITCKPALCGAPVKFSQFGVGPALGIGAEWAAFASMPNVRVAAEYNWADLRTDSMSVGGFKSKSDYEVHLFMVKLNYAL